MAWQAVTPAEQEKGMTVHQPPVSLCFRPWTTKVAAVSLIPNLSLVPLALDVRLVFAILIFAMMRVLLGGLCLVPNRQKACKKDQ
jgi:hypothetical protein